MTDLSVSPCRNCEKQAKVYCRARCKALKQYQQAAMWAIPLSSPSDRYEDYEGYGATRKGGIYFRKEKLTGLGYVKADPLSEQPITPLYKGDSNGPYQNHQA